LSSIGNRKADRQTDSKLNSSKISGRRVAAQSGPELGSASADLSIERKKLRRAGKT
jgi:hypothetical protein